MTKTLAKSAASRDHVINGDVHSPADAARTMRAYAAAFNDQATALNSLRASLEALGVRGESLALLARQCDQLRALAQKGQRHAAEFVRQFQIMRDMIAVDPDLADTQKGGWLDPARQ